jgi:hypothetical protein
VDYDEGEHGETLLFVEMAEDAWDCFFAFAVGENLDEGVGGAGAADMLALRALSLD